jgi:hypothetical protein
VQSDCARWLDEVEAALPTVVVTAKSGAGVDLVDVKVSVDGKLLVSKLDGQGVSMNAGPHTFHFEGADGTSLDQAVMIKEGVKNQPVVGVLGAAPALPAPAPGGLLQPVEDGRLGARRRRRGRARRGDGVRPHRDGRQERRALRRQSGGGHAGAATVRVAPVAIGGGGGALVAGAW